MKNPARILLGAALALLAGAGLARSQELVGDQKITGAAYLSADRLVPGSSFQVAVELTLPAPWHANANPVNVPGLVPTTLAVSGPETLVFEPVAYPPGQQVKVDWADDPVALYSGRTVIFARGSVRSDAPAGPVTLEVELRYQACDDRVCLAPQTVRLKLPSHIAEPGDPAVPLHAEVFGPSPAPALGTDAATAAEDNRIARMLDQQGLLRTLLFLFVGGLLLNLTPCVYPMIAITVSYFGGHGEGRTGHSWLRALAYCLGIVITYSALGLVAALTGGLFGALLQSPFVLLGIGLLLVLMALSMFGWFELRPPQFLVQKAAGLSSQAGYLGLFLLGGTVGIIAAPCLAPVVVVVLAFAGSSGDPWVGWWLFFALGAGLGIPYVFLASFSGLLSRLPRSGKWMVWVKRVFGVALIAVALWITHSLWLTRPAPGSSVAGGIAWQPYSESALRAAAVEQRPVIIDFYADWCIPCHEMDQRTYRHAQVIDRSKRFLMLKADLTQAGAKEVQQRAEKFGIVGVPTTVFLDVAGRELTDLRQVGFVPTDDFLALMDQALRHSPVRPDITTNAPADEARIPAELLRRF